jgi:prophage maintenance system killer protein
MKPPPNDNLEVYQTPDGELRVDVRFGQDTVWLSQEQMAALFGRERSVVTRHLKNVFSEGELDEESNVQNLHIAGSDKPVKFYALDVVISVGYRVRSKQGTQFRIWATARLREHLLRGYTFNQSKLFERGLTEVQPMLGLLQRTFQGHALANERGQAGLEVVSHYLRSFGWLLAYDEQRLASEPLHPRVPVATLALPEARAVIRQLHDALHARQEATTLFGLERGEMLSGILGGLEQTFGGEPLYPSVQSRAAHLLYFTVKDHPFADGNKRIGALLFLEYLRLNQYLFENSRERMDEKAIVALTLLIAESQSQQKDLMVRLVLSLLEEG